MQDLYLQIIFRLWYFNHQDLNISSITDKNTSKHLKKILTPKAKSKGELSNSVKSCTVFLHFTYMLDF